MAFSCGGIINAKKARLMEVINDNKGGLCQTTSQCFVDDAKKYCKTSNKKTREKLLNEISQLSDINWSLIKQRVEIFTFWRIF